MSDPKTRTDLINKAYGILATTNTPPAVEDVTSIDTYVDPLCDQLAADGIATIDPEEVPTELFMPLVRLLVNVCGPEYGSPMNDAAKESDERTLRRLNAAKPTYEVLTTEYF
jgi:hypothetical protein